MTALPQQKIKVVFIGNSLDTCERTQQLFKEIQNIKYDVNCLMGRDVVLTSIQEQIFDVYLIDVTREDLNQLIQLTQKSQFKKPVVLITENDSENDDSLMIKYGADDTIKRSSLSAELIHRVIQHNIQRRQLTESFMGERQRLEAVTGVMTTFLRTNNWASVSKQILQQVLLGTGSDAGFVVVLNANQHLTLLGSYPNDQWTLGGKPLLANQEVELPYTDLYEPMIHCLTDSVPMASSDPRKEVMKNLDMVEPDHFNHFLSLPLTNQSDVVGFIGMARKEGLYTGQENLQLFTILQTSGVVFDIYRHQHKEASLEEQLRRSQKMEAVGRLAGGVAHDFNNLLTVINGYTEILMEQNRDAGTPSLELGEILKAGKSAAQLTRQLLAFGRRQVFSPEVTSLNNIFNKMESMYRHMLKDDVTMNVNLDDNLGNACVDISQIEQVIMNLMINSQDAMPTGGTLSISTFNKTVQNTYVNGKYVMKLGEYVGFMIEDTGEGIREDDIDSIFEPFFTTREIGRGTGLGLSMVYGVVKQSGGYVMAESVVGQGTKMTVYFPRVVDDNVSEYHESPQGKKSLSSGNILVVDDDREVLTLASKVLRDKGYTVLEAYNPGEACFIAENSRKSLDLLITDVVMPIMSGRDLAERIQLTKPEMKIIYMSGCAGDDVMSYGVSDDGSNFLQKPFDIQQLVSIVEEALGFERQD